MADPPAPVLEAWAKRDWRETERLARRAIEDGHLSPRELVDAYVYLGSARAMQAKKKEAMAAFRAAGALDQDFLLPAEVNAKTVDYATVARADVAEIGSIRFSLDAPRTADAHISFSVTARLDDAHVALPRSLRFTSKDNTSGKQVEEELEVAAAVEYRVPPELVLPGSKIKVRVDALDRFKNRVASADANVSVAGGAAVAVAAPAGAVAGQKSAQERDKKKGGFWRSPWPYVIGGSLLLAAGGTSAYYFWLRPADNVHFGAPSVRTQQ